MGEFINWLFSTVNGMIALIGIGILIFLIIAFLLERRTQKMYRDRGEKVQTENDDDDGVFAGLFNFGSSDDDDDDDDSKDDDGGIGGLFASLRSSLDDWDPDEDEDEEESK
ncbi:MAG: hypothetical protein HGA54_08210 [Actinobacteria bacterium]|nr:hypothetical protein [Actinomycetota bacterium]